MGWGAPSLYRPPASGYIRMSSRLWPAQQCVRACRTRRPGRTRRGLSRPHPGAGMIGRAGTPRYRRPPCAMHGGVAEPRPQAHTFFFVFLSGKKGCSRRALGIADPGQVCCSSRAVVRSCRNRGPACLRDPMQSARAGTSRAECCLVHARWSWVGDEVRLLGLQVDCDGSHFRFVMLTDDGLEKSRCAMHRAPSVRFFESEIGMQFLGSRFYCS